MAGLNSRVPHHLPMADWLSGYDTEFRGSNYITGGDSDSSSVGRILAHYNPSINGLSHGNTSMIYCYGPICPAGSNHIPFVPEALGLNAAQSGAWTTFQNTFNQIKYLDLYMKSFIPKSLVNPWKLIFVELGFNNVCLGCVPFLKRFIFSADKYETHIRKLLDTIRSRYTNTLVTLMAPFNMSQLNIAKKKFADCKSLSPKVVGCICNEDTRWLPNSRLKMDILATEYNQRLEKIANEYAALNYSDFAVVYDPSLGQLDFVNGTMDIISGRDCFHPSFQSHNRAGVSVWNNLFKAQKDKLPMNIISPNKVDCPDENTRFWIP